MCSKSDAKQKTSRLTTLRTRRREGARGRARAGVSSVRKGKVILTHAITGVIAPTLLLLVCLFVTTEPLLLSAFVSL